MRSYSIDRKIELDAAHRVPLHNSKCMNIHGHRYVIEAMCRADYLAEKGEQQGMVLDFGFLKDEMMKEIHTPCDHGAIFSIKDPMLREMFEQHVFRTIEDAVEAYGHCMIVRNYWKVYIIEGPPTAEVLAEHWFRRLEPFVSTRSEGRAVLSGVRVHETPNCVAIYTPKRAKVLS